MYEYIARRFPLKLNLQLFAADDGASGGAGGEGGGGDGAGGSGGVGGSAGNGEKTFTQAELDQHVQQRVARAEKAAQKALAKQLGFDSVEAMQATVKPGDKDKDNKDLLDPADVDKLVDEKIKAREKEQNDKTFKRLLNAEVKVMANELGFADWEDAAALADLSAVKENDKGELEGVKDALETLAKKKPHLLKAKQGTGRIGAIINSNSTEDKKKRHEEIANLAKNRGVIGQKVVHDPWAKK